LQQKAADAKLKREAEGDETLPINDFKGLQEFKNDIETRNQ
jgi:hypothetical protein